ncbi:hypothetical protein [Streptomyces sp. 061-3]|uniref:hypothetical protein n=1 Tax=Streptomyces sp. 061-3 TaxID=2789268 RepID=UPI00397FB2A4
MSLRDAPVVTPVHRIALAIEAANRRRSYVFDGRDVPYSRMRSEIRSVARRYAFLQDWERWNVATDAVRWPAAINKLVVEALGVSSDDIFVALIPVPNENFTFGKGDLQLAEGTPRW